MQEPGIRLGACVLASVKDNSVGLPVEANLKFVVNLRLDFTDLVRLLDAGVLEHVLNERGLSVSSVARKDHERRVAVPQAREKFRVKFRGAMNDVRLAEYPLATWKQVPQFCKRIRVPIIHSRSAAALVTFHAGVVSILIRTQVA